MSGHSKWATIHRQKGVKDAARAKVFSKLARAISIAVKTGGGGNPDMNFKLRVIMDKARQSNMPKENIDRAINKATEMGEMDEVIYEGFGPSGISLMIEASTDNRNRTGQEIKNILEKAGGRLGGPNSVAFNFKPSGFILVKSLPDADSQVLAIMDLEVDDVNISEDGIEVYTKPTVTAQVRKQIEELGQIVESAELIQLPTSMQAVDQNSSQKVIAFLEGLEEHDDVLKVFTNASL